MREGTFDGPDGSRIVYARCPDGTVRPQSIRYRNGSSSEFRYNNQGVLTEVINKNSNNQVLSRWFTEDDGTTYVREIAGQTTPAEQGRLTARDDGTWIFEGQRSWQTSSNGTLSLRYQGAGGARELRIRPDGSRLELMTVGGELRPWRTVLADRTQITVIFGDNNQPRDLLVTGPPPGSQRIQYQRQENGDWIEQPSNRRGTLTLQDGIIPAFQARDGAPEVREQVRPTDSANPIEAQRQRTMRLQEGMDSLVSTLYAPRFAQENERIVREALARVGGNQDRLDPADIRRRVEAAHGELRTQIEREREALRRERELMRTASNPLEAWNRCPVSQRLYRQLVSWLEQQALPAAMRSLTGPHAAEIPAGSPQTVPQQDGLFIIPQLFGVQAANGQLPHPDLGIRGVPLELRQALLSALPENGTLQLQQDHQPLRTRLQTALDQRLLPQQAEALVRRLLGNERLSQPEVNTLRQALTPLAPPEAADLDRLGRGLNWLVEAQRQMDARRRDYELYVLMPQIIGDPRNNLPSGWLREVGQDPEARREAMREMIDLATTVRNYAAAVIALGMDQTAGVPMPPGARPVIEGSGQNRSLVRLNAVLPETLDMQNPENLRRVEQLREWLRVHGASVERAMREFARGMDPSRQIFFGQVETRGRVLCDAQGRPQRLLNPNDPENNSRNARQFNLLDYEYTVQNRADGIYVETQVTPRDASWYNYLNIGARDVCQPFRERRGPLQPSDLVAVRDGSGNTQIIQARDLDSHLRSQRLSFYGSRVLTATMDAGMLIAGLASGGTAAAALAAGRITAGAALRHGGVALFRATIGGSGFFLNNAAAHTDSLWHVVNEVRGAAMVFDITQGMVRQAGGGALRWLNLAREPQGVLTTAQRMEQFIAQSGWVVRGAHRLDQAAHLTMEVGNFGFAPLVYSDLRNLWRTAQELDQANNPFERAQQFIAGGADRAAAPRDAGQVAAEQTLDTQRRRLDSYADQLCRGRNAQTQREIRALFQRARQLLDNPSAPAAERQRLRQERERFNQDLLNFMYGQSDGLGRQIADRETSQRRTFTTEQIRTLHNNNFTPNRDVQAAAAAAFLFLANRDQQGRIAVGTVLASRQITVPRQEWHYQGERGGATHEQPERTVTQNITARDIIAMLTDDVTRTDSPSRRLVTGDLLVQSGARSPLSYAHILRDTLTARNATQADKVAAILSLGPMIHALRIQEQAGTLRGASYGVSPSELERALTQLASNQQENNDLRALAGAVLHAVRNNADPAAVERSIAGHARAMNDRHAQPGAFATHYIQELRSNSNSTDANTRLGAVLALRDMGNLGRLLSQSELADVLGSMAISGLRGNLSVVGPLMAARGVEIVNDRNNRAYNNALFSCLTRDNPGMAMIVLSQLRINNPARDLTPEQRQRVLDLLDVQTSNANTPLKRELLRQLANFAITPEERSIAIRRLEATINERETRLYAQDGELRAAAVSALASLNANNDQVRTLLTRRLNIQHEPDARVRLAAARALERLIAPGGQASQGLHRIVMEALRTESDIAVRTALLEVRGQNDRPIRDQRYMETMQAIQSRLSQGFQFDQEAIRNWITSHRQYPLLNLNNYNERRRTEAAGSANWYQRLMGAWAGGLTAAELAQRESVARTSVFIERLQQFERLAQDAQANTEDGHRARMALLYMAIGSSPPFGEDTDQFREWAARRISHICQSGSEVRGDFLEGIRLGLLSVSVPIEARRQLLEAVTHFVDNRPAGPSQALERFIANPQSMPVPDLIRAFEAPPHRMRIPNEIRQMLERFAQNPNRNAESVRQLVSQLWQCSDTRSALYRQMAASIVATSLRELDSSGWQIPRGNAAGRQSTEDYHRRMIELLHEWRYRDIYPVLEAVIRNHPYEAIQQQARQTLADLRDRIQPVWQGTSPDTDTPARQRAQNLERLLTNNTDSDDLVQALFSAARGRAIDQNDPRISSYLRALRDGGDFRPRPGESHAIDGGEKVRLAAALIILDRNERGEYINTGFSPEDRRRALEVVARTAFSGSQPGYKQDAIAILQRELNTADNSLARTILSDMLLANPTDARTVRIGNQDRTPRQLLEEFFRAQPGDLPNGTGTRESSTGRGTLVQQFYNGRLVSATETLPGGVTLRTRLVGPDLVVERFTNNRIERTALPAGRTYPGVLTRDMINDRHFTMQERISAATRLLNERNAGATPEDRRRCMSLMHVMSCGGPEDERLRWSHYLAYGEGIDNTVDRQWRDRGFVAINELATHGSAPVREQAQDYVSRFTPAQTRVCMDALLRNIDRDSAAAQQENSNLRDAHRQLMNDPHYGPAAREYFNRTGQRITPPLEQSRPDATAITRNLEQLSRLFEQSGRTSEAQTTLINAYVAARRWLPEDHPQLRSIRAQIQPSIDAICTMQAGDTRLPALRAIMHLQGHADQKRQIFEQFLTNVGNRPFVDNDDRRGFLQTMFEWTGDDRLRMQLAEALVDRRHSQLARTIALFHAMTQFGANDDNLRNRAVALVDGFQPATATERTFMYRMMEAASSRFTRAETRAQNAYFWQQYERFLVRMGEDRNSTLFQMVRNRIVEFPLPGSQVDPVSRAETLAQEASRSNRLPDLMRARRLYEQALEARRQRDGENNPDLARARLRFARFLDAMRDVSGEYDVPAIINQFEQAANAFRQQSSRTVEGAEILCQLGRAYSHYMRGSRLAQTETAYREAADIYAANANTRDNGAYARCLRELLSSQFANSHPEEAQSTLERLLELTRAELPATVRAQVLAASFEGLGLSMARGSNADAARARATAQELMTRLNGLNLTGVPVEHSNALWSAVWNIGRNLSENESTRAQSYQFFDRALDVMAAARGRGDAEFRGLLQFYADILRRHNLPERAQQVLNRANTAATPIVAAGRPSAAAGGSR